MFNDEIITKKSIASSIEMTQKSRELYYTRYLESYRSRVNEFYANEYKESPDGFDFMSSINITFLYTNIGVFNIICTSNKNTDSFSYISVWLDDSQVNKLKTIPDHLKNSEIIKLTNRKVNSDYLIKIEPDLLDSLTYKPQNIKYTNSKAYEDGLKSADDSYHTYTLAQLFKKSVTQYKELSNFIVLNLDLIFSKVKDNEFKYELEESVKAYQAELYLASATTAEISIETLLRIIIVKKLGKYKLPKESYILKSAQLLLQTSIIDKRLFNRIESINNLRHGIAHSATGEVEKWDCEQIFGLIKILVDTFF